MASVQSFPAKGCASASFAIQVQTGQVTGNLVRADGPFVAYPIFTPTNGFKLYTQVAFVPVVGLWFETLSPAGPTGQPGVNYFIKDAQVGPCLTAVPNDLTRQLSHYTIEAQPNPAAPLQLKTVVAVSGTFGSTANGGLTADPVREGKIAAQKAMKSGACGAPEPGGLPAHGGDLRRASLSKPAVGQMDSAWRSGSAPSRVFQSRAIRPRSGSPPY